MKDVECAILRVAIEVDEQVATRDQIHLREGRVLEKIVRGEKDCFSQFATDPVAARFLDEVALQALFTDVRSNGERIDSGTRSLNGAFIEVASEHLDAGST